MLYYDLIQDLPAPMLFQPRHDLDEIARPVAYIQLPLQYAGPAILAGAGRAGQAEYIGALGQPGTGARLDSRCRDLLIGDHVKDRRKSINLFFEQGFEGFGGYVMTGEAGAAGGENNVDFTIVDPALHGFADQRNVVLDDGAIGQIMTTGAEQFDQCVARFVIVQSARIGYRQNGDIDWNKLPAFINSGHSCWLHSPKG